MLETKRCIAVMCFRTWFFELLHMRGSQGPQLASKSEGGSQDSFEEASQMARIGPALGKSTATAREEMA